MASDALFMELSRALSRPSKTYRAVEQGLNIPISAMEGYDKGADFADRIRQRELARKTLSEVLGGSIEGLPPELQNAPMDTIKQIAPFAHFISKDKENAITMIPLVNKKGERIGEIPSNAKVISDQFRSPQFAGVQDGQAVIFDPNETSFTLKALPGSGPISPKVAPSIPGSEVSKLGELENLKEKLGVVSANYDPSFVGMADAPLQAIRQKTGLGASEKAANFRQAVQDIKDSLLRARSGAQINEQEYRRLLPLVPNENSSDVDFLAKLKRFEQVLDETSGSKQSAFRAAGYRPMNNTPGASTPFGGAKVPSFNSPEEAEASGHKGPALINGKRAVIH